MSESLAATRELIECAHLSPGLYRHIDTGAVIEIRQPASKPRSSGVSVPGIRFGRAVRNAPQAFMSLMSPLDEAGQMLIATMLRSYDDL